jgi:hypothetical protein
MEILFNSYENTVSGYDDLMIEAGMHLNGASWAYEGFIRDVLLKLPSGELLCEIEVPILASDGFMLDCVTKLSIVDDSVDVAFSSSVHLPWGELGVSAQDYLCQNIFMEIKKYDVSRSLFPPSA